MNIHRFSTKLTQPFTTFSLAALLVLASIATSTVTAKAAQPDTRKSGSVIIFTSMTAGPFKMVTSAQEELEDVLGADLAEGSTDGRVSAARKGDWIALTSGHDLDATGFQRLLNSGKPAIAGTRTRVTCIRKGTSTIFVEPASQTSELATRLINGDRFATESTLWELTGTDGVRVRLLGRGDAAEASRVLRDASGWAWSPAFRARSRTGEVVMALGAVEGGYAVLETAKHLAADRGALWVDGGNLVEDSNDSRGRFTLQRTLASLASGSIDALVPYKNELRLSRADQVRLAGSVPLVAANLVAPIGVTLSPYVIKTVAGKHIAVIGLVDGSVLTQNNLVGRKSGWSLRPDVDALKDAMAMASKQGAEACVVVTNKPSSALSSLHKMAGDTAAVLNFDFATAPSDRTTSITSDRALNRPWLFESVSPYEVGKLDLTFKDGGVSRLRRLQSVTFDIRRPTERDLSDPSAVWQAMEAMTAFDASLSEELLPDSRTLTRPIPSYQSEEWTMLSAAAMRRAAAADVAILSNRRGGRITHGAVPRSRVEDWLPSGTLIAKADVKGAALRKWVTTLGTTIGVAGYDPASGLIGGRPLRDDEVYRVATTESFAFSEAFADTFALGATTNLHVQGDSLADGGEGATISDIVLVRLERMKARNNGFNDGFRRELETLLGDNGKKLEPRWSLSLNPVDISFNGSTPYNTSAFSGVANSRITAPATQTLRTKGTATVAYEDPSMTWETSANLKYDASTITQSTSQQYKQLTNELKLGSQILASAIAFQAPVLDTRLVPFGELAYITEVIPGINSKTGSENPRRQDTLGTLGLSFKGTGWLREIRVGLGARKNFAAADRAVEPGAQFVLSLVKKVGVFDLSFDSLVDSFLPAAGDTANDLGLAGQFGLAAKVPVGGGFGLRIGVDGMVFRGKVPATDTLGSVITPSIGLTYGTTWKPLTGVHY